MLVGQKGVWPVLLRAEFWTKTEVACIAETGDDISVVVEAGVDGGRPESYVVGGEALLEVCDALFGGNDYTDVELLRRTVVEECLVGEFETSARCQHGVDHEESRAIELWCGEVFEMNLEILLFSLFAIGSNESGVGLVKDIDEALVEG